MNILPALSQGRLCLALIHPHAGHAWLMEPLAVLAGRGSLRVIDGGNHFNAYRLSQVIRALGFDPAPVLERVYVSRSFTCHQLAANLALPLPEASPLIVLDLLATFQDENVSLRERTHLFAACLARLKKIACSRPLLITAKTSQAEFLEALIANSDQVLQMEYQPPPVALPLFQES